MILVVLTDKVIMRYVKHGYSARWFVIHAIANFFVVVKSYQDVLRVIMDPSVAMMGHYSFAPMFYVTFIHVHHLAAFDDLRFEDFMHHLIFVGIFFWMAVSEKWGPVQNVILFFMSGLPGGIDYVLLALVKLEQIEYGVEKIVNARLNIWIRGPGLVYCAILLFQALISGNHMLKTPYYSAVPIIVLVFVNAQFYTNQAVTSTARRIPSYSW
jgi:hypothetical protein